MILQQQEPSCEISGDLFKGLFGFIGCRGFRAGEIHGIATRLCLSGAYMGVVPQEGALAIYFGAVGVLGPMAVGVKTLNPKP